MNAKPVKTTNYEDFRSAMMGELVRKFEQQYSEEIGSVTQKTDKLGDYFYSKT
jgi:hypothetical protein